jgi:hypothetical protein
VHVHIHDLVLRGFAPQQRSTLVGDLQTELKRLLAESPDIAAIGNRNLASLRQGNLSIIGGVAPTSVGTLAARHIVRELKR